jgi:hypothetical protein
VHGPAWRHCCVTRSSLLLHLRRHLHCSLESPTLAPGVRARLVDAAQKVVQTMRCVSTCLSRTGVWVGLCVCVLVVVVLVACAGGCVGG